MAFMEYRTQTSLYTNLITKGLDYIARNVDEDCDTYTLALVSYVLFQANHPLKQSAFNLLESRSRTSNGMKWWGRDVPPNETRNPWNYLPRSTDIETTSYALLTFLEADLIDDAMSIVNWLVNQGNKMGGFKSTQDTRMALLAMYKLVMRLSSESNMRVSYKYIKDMSNVFSINQDNAMVIQKFKVRNVKVVLGLVQFFL